MKLPRRPSLSRRQKILVPIGILLLIASLLFGILKFRDVFHSQPENAAVEQPAGNVDIDQQSAEEAAEESEPEEAPVQAQPKPAAKPQAEGPLEGVGTLAWVVNKRRPLNPKTYVPPNLVFPSVKLRVPGNETMKIRADAAAAAEQLFAAAAAAGHDPMFSSGYRSYSYQSSLYNSYVKSSGQAAADTFSARPGYSEHQTGLAFDICNGGNCSLQQSFANTPLGQWVAANAHTYGFTIRYKQGKEHITGYTYEPWHLRYVGVDLAAQLLGQTMEEHFGLPAAPDYL